MATKLDVLRQIIPALGSYFPDLTPWDQIYLTPKIMIVQSMAPLEIQVCEGASAYVDHDGSCRSEDFTVLVGIFRKYRLDSGGRHSKALSDLSTSLFLLKEVVLRALDGSFLTGNLLTRPLIIVSESAVTDAGGGQLLKTLNFVAGLNVEVT